jgi:1-acyl-sn-glycerol-3-phosphate acyltransferase
MLTTKNIIVIVIIALILFLWVWFLRACDRANRIDWGNKWFNRIDGLNRLFCHYYHRLSAEPLALPAQGPAILASNHVSGLDALVLIAASRRRLHFIIAREQYERFGLQWLFRAAGCIPVDRSGRPETAFREALNMLKAGHVIALFPHGRIRLDNEKPTRLKAGVVRMAKLADCPIYPFRIDGVRAQGHVTMAVFVPSRVRISGYSPIRCEADVADADYLAQLAELLERPA